VERAEALQIALIHVTCLLFYEPLHLLEPVIQAAPHGETKGNNSLACDAVDQLYVAVAVLGVGRDREGGRVGDGGNLGGIVGEDALLHLYGKGLIEVGELVQVVDDNFKA